MRVLHISPLYAQPVEALPTQEPMTGFYWVSCTRAELEIQLPAIQTMLTQVGGAPLVDLHVSDLLNPALPSNYDYTSVYDILVFRRLANAHLPPLNGTHETIAASASPASPATSSSPAPAISSAPASHRPALPTPSQRRMPPCCSAWKPSPWALRCMTMCCCPCTPTAVL